MVLSVVPMESSLGNEENALQHLNANVYKMCVMSEIKMESGRPWASDYPPLRMAGLLCEDRLGDTQPQWIESILLLAPEELLCYIQYFSGSF